jgi:hypothetical protein
MRSYRTNRLPILAATAITLALACGGTAHAAEEAAAAVTGAAEDPAMVDSSAFKLSWPKFEMPKFAWKGDDKKETGDSALTPEGNPVSRALDKVSESSKNAANNVRNAWGAAMDKLPFGGDDGKQVVQKDEKPGFFARLFSPAEEEPKGSETVQEFLAQERVGTVR